MPSSRPTLPSEKVLGKAARKWVARLWKRFSDTEMDDNAGIASVNIPGGNVTLLISDLQSCDMQWTIATSDITYFPGRFVGAMSFPDDFPFKPPKVAFTTPVFSQYVNSRGAICSGILHDQWSPAISLGQIFDDLISALRPPEKEVDEPGRGTWMLWHYPYDLYQDDPDVYRIVCNWFCHIFARPSEYIEEDGPEHSDWATRPALTSLKTIYGPDSREFLMAEQKLNAVGSGKELFEVEKELAQAAWRFVRVKF